MPYRDRYQHRQQVSDDIERDRGDGVDEDKEATMSPHRKVPELYERSG